MSFSYVIKGKNRALTSFFYNNNSIFYRSYIEGKWENKGSLINEVKNNFSVNISDEGNIYVICQGLNGDVILINNEEKIWKSRVILKNKGDNSANILFYAFIKKSEMELLYSCDYDGKNSKIMRQRVLKDKKSQGAEFIDNALSIPEGCFKVQKFDKGYVILYQKRENENQLCYREIIDNTVSEYMLCHKTAYKIVDTAFVRDKEDIYFLYVIKGMFSFQLVFRKKDKNGLSLPKIVYEGQSINKCSIFCSKGDIYACFSMNKQLFYAKSQNKGEDFSRPVRDKRYGGINWEKAFFCGYGEYSFKVNEIFIDKDRGSFPMGEEFFDGFYEKEELRNEIKDKNKLFNAQEKEKLEIENEKLKNQLEACLKRCEEKDRQIINMNNIIQGKNQEIIKAESRLIEKINELRAENERLKSEKKIELKADEGIKIKVKEK